MKHTFEAINRTGSLVVVAIVGATLALSACSSTTTMSSGAETVGESACATAVRTNAGGGRAEVVASETSTSGSRVLVLDAEGRTWSCNATNAGVVEEVSLI